MVMLENVKKFEQSSTQRVLEMLVVDRQQELAELAEAMGISTSIKGWEEMVLQSCVFFNNYLKFLIDMGPNDRPDMQKVNQCMTSMRKILCDL